MNEDRWEKLWPLARDVILFGFGLAGIALETGLWAITGRTPDPSLLVLFAGMTGLPIMLKKDEK